MPSAAWRGREAELQEFYAWNQAVNFRWCRRYPMEVMRFRHQFYLEGTQASAEGRLA